MQIIEPARFQEITENFSSQGPILVVGDVGLDKYTTGEAHRISPEAPVPVLEVKGEWEKLGLAANISHNLKTLGLDSFLCGVLGKDEKARRFEGLLESIDLKIWGLVQDPSRRTIFKQRIIAGPQQICRVDYEESDPIDESVAERLKNRIDDLCQSEVRGIIIEDYAKGTFSEGLLRHLIDKHKSEGRLVAVDPGKGTPPSWYRGASLLKPNYPEAISMVDALGYGNRIPKDNIAEIAAFLLDKLELEKLVITQGSSGMALLDREGELIHIPTVADEVFDVSGAGDTAISLLSASLLAGASLEEAAWIGNCGSGVVVAKKGTATVNLEELHDFYHKLQGSYASET